MWCFGRQELLLKIGIYGGQKLDEKAINKGTYSLPFSHLTESKTQEA